MRNSARLRWIEDEVDSLYFYVRNATREPRREQNEDQRVMNEKIDALIREN